MRPEGNAQPIGQKPQFIEPGSLIKTVYIDLISPYTLQRIEKSLDVVSSDFLGFVGLEPTIHILNAQQFFISVHM